MRQLSMRQAAIVQFVSKYSSVVVSLAIAMVLARLVTPEQYGAVAVVTVFTNFFSVLSDMGLSAGVVQHKELGEREIIGLFLFSLGAAAVLAVLFALTSVPASMIYGGSSGEAQVSLLRSLFLAATPGVFFSALNTVPNGVLMREKRFLAIGVRLVAVNLFTGCVAIAMAMCGFGCYALVAQFVISRTLLFAYSFVLSGLRVQRVPVLEPLRVVLGFSFFQLAHGFVNYFSANLDNLLVGAFFGSSALGYYDKAYKVTGYPVAGLSSIVASVLHPYLSDSQSRPDEVYERFVAITRGFFVVGILVSACLVAAPREVIELMFGGQWSASAPLLCVLGACVMFKMVVSLTGAVFQSLGDTWDMFLSAVVNTSITVVAICAGAASGQLVVLAALVSAAYCVNPVATYYFLVARAFRRSLGEFARMFAPQLAVAGVMLVVGSCLRVVFVESGMLAYTGADLAASWLAPSPLLVVKVMLCTAVYTVLLVVTGQWRYLRVFLRSG